MFPLQGSIGNFFAILSVVIGVLAFIPYFKDVLSGKTQPHEFTWLILVITQGTATALLWHGGGGKGAIYLTVGTFLTMVIFVLSLFDGKRDITKSDTVVLCVALSAIFIWWLLENPLLAVILLSAIDVIGYIPTFRKSYSRPWTETASLWTAFALADVCSILALETFNALTLIYLVSITSANIALVIFLMMRRRKIPS